MHKITHKHTHTHTFHPVLSQSLPAAIVTELTVLLSLRAVTVTAAAEEDVCINVRLETPSPITSSLSIVSTLGLLSFLDLWLL